MPIQITPLFACLTALALGPAIKAASPVPFQLVVNQITHGDKQHIFGYIGQCRTIPWNASGRYILIIDFISF